MTLRRKPLTAATLMPVGMSLSEKSDEEIIKLLAEYGVKHRLIIDWTWKLYVKKLEKVMEDAPVKVSSDKTYYREEEEVITYTPYHSPVRHGGYVDMTSIQSSSRTANYSAGRSREPITKSGGCVWKVIRLLLLLAVLAAVFYYAYCHVRNGGKKTSFRL